MDIYVIVSTFVSVILYVQELNPLPPHTKNTPTLVGVLRMNSGSRCLLLLQQDRLLTLTGKDIEEQVQEDRHEASGHNSIIGENADRFGHLREEFGHSGDSETHSNRARNDQEILL